MGSVVLICLKYILKSPVKLVEVTLIDDDDIWGFQYSSFLSYMICFSAANVHVA